MVVVIIWIGAYTLCLVNVALLIHRYTTFRDKRVLLFLVFLVNMLLVTVVTMYAARLTKGESIFNTILINCLLSYLLTIPPFVYAAAQVKIPVSLIGTVAVISFIGFNLLSRFVAPLVTYALYLLPFLVEMMPLAIAGRKAHPASTDNVDERLTRSISRLGRLLGSITFTLICLYFVLIRTSLRTSVFFVSSYFAFFTILYQLPVSFFCLITFPRALGDTSDHEEDNEILHVAPPDGVPANLPNLNLTEREREVALKLYEGLTYHQIADSMFVTLSAIKKHVYNIYRKTGVRNNRQLIRKMIGERTRHRPG